MLPGISHGNTAASNFFSQIPALQKQNPNALAQLVKPQDPLQHALSKAKPYANYQERKQDEEQEFQKEVMKKGVLGTGLKNMMSDMSKRPAP